ncbi:MAG: ubiquinol-cytochrome C chaperone family protein [Phenylobacterium sp.]|uniref:ubiquinol-cytochrome C chaperone family protein n=1 Tax=Phenylobacterium sp. TaxID=1871053 RepID=UPI00391A0E54
MFFDRFFKRRPALAAGAKLYAAAVARARNPRLYADYAAPDTVEGRFELYTLHVFLLLDRLRGEGPQASETSQALFDTYVTALDDALREMGVGDLSVGKKMRKLGEAFYGRVKSYEKAFQALPDAAALEALVARTVYAGGDAQAAPKLAAYVVTERAALREAPVARLLAGDAPWSEA